MRRLLQSSILGMALVAAAGSTSATAAVVLPAADGIATSARPAVEMCGTGLAVTRPGSMILTCADDGTLGKDLHWTNWTTARATATGIVTCLRAGLCVQQPLAQRQR